MGNPIFRFTLRHAEVGDLEISEPIGWIEAKLKLERHEDFHSLVEYFEGAFIFYGTNGVDNGGIDFIRYVEQNYGPDATLRIEIEVSFDSGRTYDNIFFGQLDLTSINELKDNRAQIAIIRDDFWAKFISRKDTTVDLQAESDLDEEVINPVDRIDIDLPSQKVRQIYSGYFDVGVMYSDPGDDYADDYLQIDPTFVVLDEIEEKFTLPNAANEALPVWIIEAKYAGSYYFDLRVEASEASVITPPDNLNGLVSLYIQINEQTPIPFTATDHGGGGSAESTSYVYQGTINLNATDVVRIYGVVDSPILGGNDFYVWGISNPDVYSFFEPAVPSGVASPSYFYVEAQTVYPKTRSQSFLLHDAGAAVLKSYGLGEENPFYSEYLGGLLTNARVYESDGCGWHYAVVKGLQLRGYQLNEKTFFLSFDQWWRGANPIFNLGLGYDETATTPDQSLIRVEKKSYFYSREISTNFDYVFEISREYDDARIFNKIEIGYANWQSEDISGIDDPQTKHTYATRFKKIGKGIQVHSDFIAASLAIEVTRRQTIEKSKDYKFDNNTFIISINPDDLSPDAYTPELDENFSSITNLLNSETRYNSRLTVGRNFLRWRNYFNGALQSYTSSNYKFVWGEGNYDMTSNLVSSCDVSGELSEKQNINVSSDYLHLPLLYTIEINLAWQDYVAIRDARHKAIGISQTDSNHAMFFIKSLEYELIKGKATIKAWPLEYFNITQTDFVPTMRQCQVAGSCGTNEDDRTTSEGEGRTTSEGECRTIA